jgi:hypothetical protein
MKWVILGDKFHQRNQQFSIFSEMIRIRRILASKQMKK